MQLLFAACSDNLLNNELSSFNDAGSYEAFLEKWDVLNSYKNACTSVTDAFLFPENWTEEDLTAFDNLPEERFRLMSTCGLLKTLLEHPTNRMTGTWCVYCSDSKLQGVTNFNNSLQINRAAMELFERDDCFPVLASNYLTLIKEKREINSQIRYFEMLLASDMCMSALSKAEKVLLMAMALEKKGSDKEFLTSAPYIMTSIMRTCNYAPFMKDVSPNLVEYTLGYSNINDYDIIRYAKQFLNEQK
jgi:hypothetical protein